MNWSGSASPYRTVGDSSPGTPSRRGVPRRPAARTTFAAGKSPASVRTTKRPSSPSIPLTFTPSWKEMCVPSTMRWKVSSSSSFEMWRRPNFPQIGSSTGSVITIFSRG